MLILSIRIGFYWQNYILSYNLTHFYTLLYVSFLKHFIIGLLGLLALPGLALAQKYPDVLDSNILESQLDFVKTKAQ